MFDVWWGKLEKAVGEILTAFITVYHCLHSFPCSLLYYWLSYSASYSRCKKSKISTLAASDSGASSVSKSSFESCAKSASDPGKRVLNESSVRKV